jgi:hypothetical protein
MASSRSTLAIKVNPRIRAVAERHIAEEQYSDVSEYFAALVRDREKQRARDAVMRLVAEAESSGPDIEGTPEYVAAAKARLHEKINRVASRRKRA